MAQDRYFDRNPAYRLVPSKLTNLKQEIRILITEGEFPSMKINDYSGKSLSTTYQICPSKIEIEGSSQHFCKSIYDDVRPLKHLCYEFLLFTKVFTEEIILDDECNDSSATHRYKIRVPIEINDIFTYGVMIFEVRTSLFEASQNSSWSIVKQPDTGLIVVLAREPRCVSIQGQLPMNNFGDPSTSVSAMLRTTFINTYINQKAGGNKLIPFSMIPTIPHYNLIRSGIDTWKFYFQNVAKNDARFSQGHTEFIGLCINLAEEASARKTKMIEETKPNPVELRNYIDHMWETQKKKLIDELIRLNADACLNW